MNTGQAFEQEIEDYLIRELEHGNLGIVPDYAQVYRHKGYYSSLRDKYIVVDVSLELTRPGASEPFWIWVWECKDYANKVPVDDVEEFHAKLEQVGIHKIKGTIACRNGFQESAIRVARGWGIGLIRILPPGSVFRLLEAKRTTSMDSSLFGLTESETRNLTSKFYGISSGGSPLISVQDLIQTELRECS